MRGKKKYNVGDRIFYEDGDGIIKSDIIIKISDKFYLNNKGERVEYQWLTVEEGEKWSSGIENYSCLSPSNPKCKELVKQYSKFDKQKDAIIESIMEIITQFDKKTQKDILKLLEKKIKMV